MKHPSLLRSAWRLLSVRFLLQQIVLALAAFILFAAWLRVPDGTVMAVAASGLLALVILFVAFLGEAWLLLSLRGSLRGSPKQPRDLAKGAAALLLAVALLFPLSMLLARASAEDALLAGYLNSRFPAGMRNIFSYAHIYTMLQEIWASLFWMGAIVLTMAAVAVTVAERALPPLGRMLQSVTGWVVLSVAIVGSSATSELLYWTPGRGLAIQATSVVLRLLITTLLVAFLLCLSLALLVVLADEGDARYLPAEEGTPDLSQPRTAGNP
jgi:hypothetical protein